MVKTQKRVNYGLEVLQYYTTKEWFFENDYYRSLRNQISKADDETFYTDIEVRFKSQTLHCHIFISIK